MLKLSECFSSAAEYLRRYGWTTGTMGHDQKPRCMVGALHAVCPERFEDNGPWLAKKELKKVFDAEFAGITPYYSPPAGRAVAWNDRQTKAAVVIDKLEEIAGKLAANGQ